MKRILVFTAALLLMIGTQANAEGLGSGFGALTEANTIGMGNGNLMGAVGLADATSFFGKFTYGLSEHSDGSIKIGLVDGDYSDTKLMFGADFKYNFLSRDSSGRVPFDMSLGGLFEYYDFDGASAWYLGGMFIGSYPIVLNNNSRLVPYGRFNVRIENYDVGMADDSNLELGINAGLKWEISQTMDFYGEFQFDGNDGIFVGLDFNVM